MSFSPAEAPQDDSKCESPSTALDLAKSPQPAPVPTPERATAAVRFWDGTSEARLVRLLRDRGGQMTAGQRVFADALGVSKTQIHRLLSELVEAGRISVAVGTRGTAVCLLGAAH